MTGKIALEASIESIKDIISESSDLESTMSKGENLIINTDSEKIVKY